MIKGLLISVLLFAGYSIILKPYLSNKSEVQKELDESIQPKEDIVKKHTQFDDMGPEVKDLGRYRSEMLEKVNEINQMIKSPEKVDFIKKMITKNKGIEQIKSDLKNNEQFVKIKEFVLKFGSKNIQFIEAQKKLSAKDAQFFEVNKPMTLEDYKKKFNIKKTNN